MLFNHHLYLLLEIDNDIHLVDYEFLDCFYEIVIICLLYEIEFDALNFKRLGGSLKLDKLIN